MELEKLNGILENHKRWLKKEVGGSVRRGSVRRESVRRESVRRGSVRRGHRLLDVAAVGGSISANIDDRVAIQLLYHTLSAALKSKNTSMVVKKELSKLVRLANCFHRVDECGKLTPFVEETAASKEAEK